jgi:eukaryotic-like serine/threonine-protein kinase
MKQQGFRWCPHCKGPHSLEDRLCASTGLPLETPLHRAAPPPTAAAPLIGLVLDGKYRILRLIGEGGMGQVYEAENLRLKRLVAIKVVGSGTRREALERLEREAQLVAAIQHPNICDVHDVGHMPEGGPYVVFERLFGETLAARTRGRRQLPLYAAIDLFSQMLSGLQAAHVASIIHRDLKPENVFLVDRVGCEPLVKLVDFGFARDLTSAAVRITRPGRSCGTLQYMSPEQLRCESIDHRSDLFAVGIMLYEVLAGRHPFEASSLTELQANILRSAPLPLRVRRPEVPQALEELIGWALARTPAARPSSAIELQRALVASAPQASPASTADDDAVSVTEPVWIPPTASPSA